MTEKDRLLQTLFQSEGEEHLNIKFCRGTADDISTEALCREANSAILQMRLGVVDTTDTVNEDERKSIDVNELFGVAR